MLMTAAAQGDTADGNVSSARLEAISSVIGSIPLAVPSGLGLLILWQLVITAFGVPEYIAPSPAAVAKVYIEQGGMIVTNLWPTLFEALSGFMCGNFAAILIAIVFVHNSIVERAFYPLVVVLHTIPIIAIAPILVLLFGNGYAPKIMIAALISFFPMLVNMVRGLKAVKPETMELMHILSATRGEVLWNVRIQSSLPFLFSALKISSTTCVIGALVGEWIGSNFGLGALIIEATYNFRSPLLYATVLVGAALALSLFGIMSLLERRVIRWNVGAVIG
jgi:NitT/TauT family transport system permease protein